ncbi:hypothetical protein BpHYR1_040137 [Brachionus plicatilis]|uniref:Uncharacterized protein n=1 Tax=Brachionus plicatilis TaxID=10195 RepID=A0A3M7QX71_BRAPC|nr:hypothetical protein BpHYR1_040137 [Brachionus plicatilis]
MVCDGDRCSFEGQPYFEYRWLEERVGYSLNDRLFERANNQCTAKELFCQVGKSTYIWNPDIIHECPLRNVEKKEIQN